MGVRYIDLVHLGGGEGIARLVPDIRGADPWPQLCSSSAMGESFGGQIYRYCSPRGPTL